ncbi:MAG: DNA-directed RNA polymerase [DPANN group archaeon]|nr:DNA-directed RNA polymerase [DPANN group archaeon]
MFYKVKVKDHIRVPPNKFGMDLKQAIVEEIKQKYSGFISKDLGMVIDVSGLGEVGEGIIVPGDGASYYQASFDLLTFEPEMQEVIPGRIRDIADFGAFITMGPIDGMIHISQTINDFVSFSKDKVLQGKDTKRVLKVNDKCKARIIQISYKDIANPKIGLTMRQQGLGRDDWINEDLNKTTAKTKKAEEKKEKK